MSELLVLRFCELKFKSRPLMPLVAEDQLNPLLPTFTGSPEFALRLPGRRRARPAAAEGFRPS